MFIMVKRLFLITFIFISVKLFAQTPQLSNFRVEDSQTSRVYFDSSEPVTGSNASGFIISGKSISGVSIIANQTTGHYFTVTSAFDFWDNNTIRYAGGSDIGVHSFDLQYIKNEIPEPEASTLRYVSASATGSGDGTSDGSAWTISQANNNASAGQTVYIKAGSYGNVTLAPSRSGTPTNPIKFIGYNVTDGAGNRPNYNWTHSGVAGGGTALDPSKMPYFSGSGSGDGIYASTNNTIFKYFQLRNYDRGFRATADNVWLDNLYAHAMPSGSYSIYFQDGTSQCRLTNSVAYNAGTALIRMYGNYNLSDGNTAIDDTDGVDYYLSTRGSNNIHRNAYLERLCPSESAHKGHGITIKSDKAGAPNCNYSLNEFMTIKGVELAIEARKEGTDYNVWRDINISENVTRLGVKGLIIMQGADNNVFDRIKINDTRYGINFVNTDSETNGSVGNVIKNSTFSNIETGIMFGPQYVSGVRDEFNLIINNTFYNVTGGGSELIETNNSAAVGVNYFYNNNVENSSNLGNSGSFDFENNNFFNCGTTVDVLVGGNNNIDANPFMTNPANLDFSLSANTPTSVSKGGVVNFNVRYGANGVERSSPVSIGAYEESAPVVGSVTPSLVTICNGESVVLVASGGTSYSWNTGETTASITVSPSSTTTYTVIVTNGSESDSHDVVVTVNEAATVDLGPDQSICFGETITLTATGTGDYLWNTGETTGNIIVSPTTTTTYSVTASNSCAVDATDEIIVNVNPEIGLTVGSDVSICIGETTTLTATGNGDFLWSTGETTPSITVQPNTTTTYSVMSTIGSCTENDSILVTVSEIPTVDLGADQSICYGETVTLTATGIGNFLWNTGETTASIAVSPTTTTTYSVTASNSCATDATDDIIINVNPEIGLTVGSDISICVGESTTLTATGNGDFLWNTGETTPSITVQPNSTTAYSVSSTLGACTENESVLVTVDVAPSVDLGSDQSICFGETITLTASGTGNFLWNTGETTASITVSPTTTTTYTVTASNACSDSVSDDIIINVNPEIGLTIGNDISICTGESTTLTAAGNGDFLWSTGETTSSITVQPNSTTTYTVTSTLGNCTESESVIVTINDSASVDLGPDKSICSGENVTLTASGSGNFLWNTGETTASITISPTATTTYSVTASNSCSSDVTDDIIVNVNDLPSVNAGADITIINGESTTLTATGTGSFLWSTGETSSSITVNPNSTITYSVVLTSDQGCSNQDSVIVTVENNESINADAGSDQNVCPDSDTILTASGGGSYLWSTGEATASITVSPSVTTVYTVAVYQGNSHAYDDVTVFIDENCSNNTSSIQQELKLYPNPTNGLVNLEMTGFNGDLNVSLYNLNGSVVHVENMDNGSKEKVLKKQINLSMLAKGMYFVRVNNGTQVVTKKLLVI